MPIRLMETMREFTPLTPECRELACDGIPFCSLRTAARPWQLQHSELPLAAAGAMDRTIMLDADVKPAIFAVGLVGGGGRLRLSASPIRETSVPLRKTSA